MSHITKKAKLIWTFYRSFLFMSMVVTAVSLILFWKFGYRAFAGVMWLKIITLAFTVYYISTFRSKEFYYYQNLGLSRLLLWTVSMLLDLSIFLFFIIQLSRYK